VILGTPLLKALLGPQYANLGVVAGISSFIFQLPLMLILFEVSEAGLVMSWGSCDWLGLAAGRFSGKASERGPCLLVAGAAAARSSCGCVALSGAGRSCG